MKNLRERSGGIEDFDHKLDDKLIAFEDSGHDKKTFARIDNNVRFGATALSERRGLVSTQRHRRNAPERDPDERHFWANIQMHADRDVNAARNILL
ncbi:MAG: hypothetical protein QXN78_06930 [Conexivisphaerales archaeon]